VPANPIVCLVGAACRRPWITVAGALLLTALALAFTATHFAMTTDTAALISPKVPWRMAERRMDAAFPQNSDTLLAVIDGATPELAEQAADTLATRLAADHHHFTRVTQPDGGAFFATEGLLFGSEAEVSATTEAMVGAQPFLGPLASDPSLRGIAGAIGTMARGIEQGQAPLARIRQPITTLADALDAQAAGRPAFFSWQTLFSGSGGPVSAPTRRLVLVTPVLDYGALMPGEGASDAIRAAAAALALDPAHGVTVRLTGSVALSDEEFASIADKIWLIGLVMLAAMLLTLWLATRSWRITAAILATTLSGLVITTGLGLAAVGQLNLISVAFIPLFVGLGVDFGIQIGVRFQAERLVHDRPVEAMAAAAGALAGPLLLAAGAVCLGFLAFLPTAYVGVAELGVIAGIGMIVALALALTMLPALLMLARPPRPRAEVGSPALAPLDHFLATRRRLVLGLFALSMAASIASLAFVRFDFDPLHLRNVHSEAMATIIDLMHDPDRNPNTIDILTPNLAAARALAPRLAALPEVGQVVTIDGFVPADQPPKLAAIANAQALLEFSLDPFVPSLPPTDAETVAALRATAATLDKASQGGAAAGDAHRLALAFTRLAAGPPDMRRKAEAMLVQPLAVMLDQMRQALAAQPVALATLPADLRADWIAKDGQARIQLTPRAGADNAALARFVAAVQAIAPQASGTAVSIQAAASTIARAFVEAGILALVAVSLLLFAVLRSVKEVAFTLAPVVLSGFLTLGTCVLIGQSINFANIIAFPLLFGVGTAFHIYFVMAWRAGATDLLQSPLARAVFFSALATGSAFGSLWLSSHPGTASMGKILMISLAWTLVCALIFEPALLGPAEEPSPLGERDGRRQAAG
jgi:hopanoid biosynthesis associated RND transporter like protein HpnN